MSEISINTVENIDEVEQKSLLITCAAKLHRYYWVTVHFLDFHRKDFPKVSPTPLLLTPSPFYYLRKSSRYSWAPCAPHEEFIDKEKNSKIKATVKGN